MENEVMYIKLDDIVPNRFQPREVFDEVALNELADSIRHHGVLEPILVRPVGNKFEIIAGERRYKASALAGLTSIPALVKRIDDKESSIIAFIENAQRKDVSAIEAAKTAQRILKNNNMTQDELASTAGISRSYLANKLRLLALPLEVQESLMKGEISERHARSLLSVKEESKQLELLKRIKEKKMTVRELDGEIKSMNDSFLNEGNVMPNGNDQGFVSYLNTANSSNGSTVIEPQGTSSFLNSYDANPAAGNTTTSNPGFMEYLNDNDVRPQTNEIPNYSNSANMSNITPLSGSPADNDFMSFLNGVDNNPAIPAPNSASLEGQPSTEGVPVTDNGFMEFLNSVDSNPTIPSPSNTSLEGQPPAEGTPATDNGFMEYLNDVDNNPAISNPTSVESQSTIGESQASDNGFMEYLNSTDNNPNIPEIGQTEIGDVKTEMNVDFTNFLNNYDNNNPVFNQPTIDQITENVSQPKMDVNGYVEDNPNFVDVSKTLTFSSVDEIIKDLKNEIDNIKAHSKYKIDTEEINFDDIYQVTIKIDKRDF